MYTLSVIGSASLSTLAFCLIYLAYQQAGTRISLVSENADKDVLQNVESLVPHTRMISEKRPDGFFQAITQRPLFEESRRPIVPVEEMNLEDAAPVPELITLPEVEVQPPPSIQILGMTTGGSKNSALLSVDGGSPQWFLEGDYISSWEIKIIRPDAIELKEGDREIKIDLYQR